MLTYKELAEMGFCPGNQRAGAKLPDGWVLPGSCEDSVFKQLPLHIQIFYSVNKTEDGKHLSTI